MVIWVLQRVQIYAWAGAVWGWLSERGMGRGIPMRDLLKRHFGYDEFLPLQEEIISTVLEERDALVLMPTGGGKLLCYQLPAMYLKG